MQGVRVHVKCILLGERSHIQKEKFCMILIRYSGKGKIIVGEIRSEVARYR